MTTRPLPTPRWAIAVLATLLLGACAGSGAPSATGGTSPTTGARPRATRPGPPDVTRPPVGCAPEVVLCNIAVSAGLGDDLTYGRGVAFADVDGDGFDDVFIADTDGRIEGDVFGVSGTYLNRGDATYRRTDVGIDPDDLNGTWGGAFGDYDNDGDPDLLLTNGGYTRDSNVALYRNEMRDQGRFVEVSGPAGIDAALPAPKSWWGGSWADYDNDGWTDFVVIVRNEPLHLFHNDGDGTFTDVTSTFAFGDGHVDAHNGVWLDMDGDSDSDLFVTDMDVDRDRSHLYENRVREGRGFVDVTAERIGDVYKDLPGVFEAVAADFNQDGAEDLYLGRWTLQDLVLVNDGTGRFRAYGREVGIDMKVAISTIKHHSGTSKAESENTMGLGVGDVDDDDDPDVFIGTGDPANANLDIVLCDELDPASPAGFRFVRCSQPFVDGHGPSRGHGVAFSDTDDDGDTDLVWAFGGHPSWDEEHRDQDTRENNAYYQNRSDAGTRTASIDVWGTRSGTDALGARLRIDTGAAVRYEWVRNVQGFNSQNSRVILVDTGPAREAAVEVRWPSGATTRATVRAGTRTRISEDGEVTTGPRGSPTRPDGTPATPSTQRAP